MTDLAAELARYIHPEKWHALENPWPFGARRIGWLICALGNGRQTLMTGRVLVTN
jgi:hypothetical protein